MRSARHRVRSYSRARAPGQLVALTGGIGLKRVDYAWPGLQRPPDRAAIDVDRAAGVDRTQVVAIRVLAETPFPEDDDSAPYRGIAGFNRLPSRRPVAEESFTCGNIAMPLD
jgi:hypothetical protein